MASGRTQIGTADSMKLSPDQASSSVSPMVSAMAVAAAGGTALPMRSRQVASDIPSNSRCSSGSTRLCNAASLICSRDVHDAVCYLASTRPCAETGALRPSSPVQKSDTVFPKQSLMGAASNGWEWWSADLKSRHPRLKRLLIRSTGVPSRRGTARLILWSKKPNWL